MGNQKVNYQITGENLLSKVLRQIDSDANHTEQSINNISGKGGSGGGLMGSIIGANLFTAAIQKAGSAVFDFAKGSVEAYGKQEQFLVSLKTMFHGNTEEARTLNNELKTFAKTTPFELTEIQAATRQMIAYGSTSGGVVDEMRMLGDVSSGVGSSLSEVGYLYGTLRTQGRAFSKDIYQFTGRGIPIVKELAKQFKVTDSEVMKLVEDGKVGFKEVEKAFKSMTSEGGQFFGMMSEQSKTLNGQISNLGDSWDQLKSNIGESQSGILKSTIEWASKMVETANQSAAAGNFLDLSYGKSGITGASGMSNFLGNLGYNTKGRELKGEAHAGQMMIEESKTANDVLLNIKVLQALQKQSGESLRKALTSNDVGVRLPALEDFNAKNAIWNETLKELGGKLAAMRSKNSTSATGNEEEEKKKNEKLGTGVTIESQAPKNQYITINGGLVHQMNIESMDGSTPTKQIKDKVSAVLIELLNDAWQATK